MRYCRVLGSADGAGQAGEFGNKQEEGIGLACFREYIGGQLIGNLASALQRTVSRFVPSGKAESPLGRNGVYYARSSCIHVLVVGRPWL